MTDQTSAHDPLSYLPIGVLFEDMKKMADKDPVYFTEQARDSMAKHVKAMVGFMDKGAEVFDYGNSIRDEARKAGYDRAFDFPGFVPAYIRPQFEEGLGPFRWAALSGDPKDIEATDRAILELFPDNEHLRRWITMAEERVAYQGLPARICWLGYGERHRAGLKFNEMVASGELSAPIVIGRDHLDSGSVASPVSGDRGDGRRLRRHRGLAAAERLGEHRVRRIVGVDPPRRRRRDGPLHPRGPGMCGRRDGARGAEARTGARPTIPAWASSATPMPATSTPPRSPPSGVSEFPCKRSEYGTSMPNSTPCGSRSSTSVANPPPAAIADSPGPQPISRCANGSPPKPQRRGMTVEEDRNGNMWAWWMPAGLERRPEGRVRHRIAPRLGARRRCVRRAPRRGVGVPRGRSSSAPAVSTPVIPIAVVAFADEEGARFGVACVGSQLSTGALTADRALRLRDNDGTTLADALRDAGRRPEQLGADDTLTDRVGVYVELHVEQGRALEDLGQPVAVASSIWPHGRWHLTFGGEANHAGTTRLIDRRDPMLPFASAVHAARIEAGASRQRRDVRQGQGQPERRERHSVACRCVAGRARRRRGHPGRRRRRDPGRGRAIRQGRPRHRWTSRPSRSPRSSSSPMRRACGLQAALSRFGEVPVLPTAAGHDAGILSAKVPTAMLFVRNPTGVSHSPEEYAEIADCRTGAEALADVMADWVSR